MEEQSTIMNALTLGGSFGAMMTSIIKTGLFEGIDTSWTMTILALAGLIAKITKATGLFGLEILNDYSFGIFESYVVCIAMLIWYGVPLLLKSIRATNTIGISIEDTLRNWNGVLLAIVVISQMFTAMPKETTALLASSSAGGAQGGISKGVYIVICVFVFIITMLLYYVVRYLFTMIDVIMVPVHAFVPFASLLSVICKFLLICFLFFLSSVAPVLFLIVAGSIVFIAVLFFRTAYRSTRYFKHIYTRPFFKRIFGGFDKEIPLLDKKIPSKVRKYLEGMYPELVIPIYVLKPMPTVKMMHKWERWWLVCKQGERFLLRPMATKRDCYRFDLYNPKEHKMFINRFLFYHEIFVISGTEDCLTRTIRKIPKHFHLVFSKEYSHRYEEIAKILNFVELADYTNFKKQSLPPKEGFFARFKRKKEAKESQSE